MPPILGDAARGSRNGNGGGDANASTGGGHSAGGGRSVGGGGDGARASGSGSGGGDGGVGAADGVGAASPPPNATLPMTAAALAEVARQLAGAYTRLHGRSGGEPPAVSVLVLGLGALARETAARHAPATAATRAPPGAQPPTLPVVRTAPPPPPVSPAEVRRLRHYLVLASAAYAPTPAAALAVAPCLDPSVGILDGRWTASPYHPAYYVALDAATDAVVVAVRGTRTLGDILTNLSASTDGTFLGRHAAHRGVAAAAIALADRLGPRLADALRRYRPAGGVVLVGHSLGGAISSLLTAALRAADGGGVLAGLTCFAYGPPPCADAALAAGISGVTAVVLGDDAVPRLSSASVDRLVTRAAAAQWGATVGEGVTAGLHGWLGGALGTSAVDALGGLVRSHGGGAAAAACGALADWAAAQGGGGSGGNIGSRGGSGGGGGGGDGGGGTTSGLWRAAMAVTSLTASLAGQQITAGVAAAGERGSNRPGGSRAGGPARGRPPPAVSATSGASARSDGGGDGGGRSYADIWAAATVAGATTRPSRLPARGGGGGGSGGSGGGGGGDGRIDADRHDDWTVARAYGVSPAAVEAHIVGPLPPDLYLVGRILFLERTTGPVGGGPTPTVEPSVVAATATALHDVRVSEWMLTDHSTAAMDRALASLCPENAGGGG
ncbi:hypothetical protein MMPV_003672 [Pyropia vietnamensis]